MKYTIEFRGGPWDGLTFHGVPYPEFIQVVGEKGQLTIYEVESDKTEGDGFRLTMSPYIFCGAMLGEGDA